ncbi:MAG: nucleotide sugar dehydrogenase [Fimbriimonadales bacterium]|nr:nucleotide sugar dehydrogenase [Fimbriimonadales bacterium]
MQFRKVVVVGAGYVGLPTAALLAKSGLETVAFDINKDHVDAINEGTLRVEEDSINALLTDKTVRQNLRAAIEIEPADVFFICVPTPIDPKRKIADLSHVVSACETIASVLQKGNLVIVESTIPVLCTRETVKPILERSGLKIDADVCLAHCPERVLPGNAIHEITNNSRVIGGISEKSSNAAVRIYRHFVNGELHIATDVEAEICKLSENAYRDVNIAFANELAALCEQINVDPMRVIEMANHHPRVNILNPGIGVGGHCIPVDPWFISEIDRENSTLIQCARRINDARPEKIAARIRQAVADIPNPKIVAVGTAFKTNCKDQRESPAMRVIELLTCDGYDVHPIDPEVQGDSYPGLEQAAQNADLIVVLVEHDSVIDELSEREERILDAMRNPRILRLYRPALTTSLSTIALASVAA